MLPTCDARLRDTHFGVRPHRSTQEPRFILGRLLEVVEREGTTADALLVDWAQAFDRLEHLPILRGLITMGSPSSLVSTVADVHHCLTC